MSPMQTQVPGKEVKLLPIITQEYVEQSKFDRWCTCFFDKSNKDTYLNRTKSALAVYDTDSYGSASSIGYQNFRKLQNWRGILRNYAEDIGITLPVIFRKAVNKFDTTNNPEWLKILMRMMGDAEFVEEAKETMGFSFKDGDKEVKFVVTRSE